jgi:hypothetical protein
MEFPEDSLLFDISYMGSRVGGSHLQYSVAPKYEFMLRSKGIVKRVAGTFRRYCQQTFGSPRQFPHTSTAKICIKKGGTEPEMLTYYPQDPQNCE